MKHTRKLLSLLLALCLVAALAVPAFAVTFTWEMLQKGYDDPNTGKHYSGNIILCDESAYTAESAKALLTAFQAYQDETDRDKAIEIYNQQFKPAAMNLAFVKNTFTDAQSGWYVDAVNYAQGSGTMNGMGGGKFVPNGIVTRAQAVTVLWRIMGSVKANTTVTFKDVPKTAGTAWYYDAVAWAMENGITNGTSETTFSPDAPVTREQMASFFVRMIETADDDHQPLMILVSGSPESIKSYLSQTYKDANSISNYAAENMMVCVQIKLMKGTSPSTLEPQGKITRAQIAQMLMNYYSILMDQATNLKFDF